MINDVIKKSVSYKALIKLGEDYYLLGTIIIKTYEGCIFYSPSNKLLLQMGKEVDHITWHASGQTHLRFIDGSIEIIQGSQSRQTTKELGFQELIRDSVKDYKLLPKYRREITDLDVVFGVVDYFGPVVFVLSLVSGVLIVSGYQGKKVSISQIDKSLTIDSTIRALGWHSGNSDKVIQYVLRKDNSNYVTNRHILVVHDQKIAKSN